MVIVLNASQYSTPIVRMAQVIKANSVSWIDYVMGTHELNIYVNNKPPITLKVGHPDLSTNKYFVFLSLRGNQLASFYNCDITDSYIIRDSSISRALLTYNTVGVEGIKIDLFNNFLFKRLILDKTKKGQVIFNRNLSEIFELYSCERFEEAYSQIYRKTNNLVKNYCELSLNDMHQVNTQMNELIETIVYDKEEVLNVIGQIETNMQYCSGNVKKRIDNN
jgi:hypothetical protein